MDKYADSQRDFPLKLKEAVRSFWQTRELQTAGQQARGKSDQGARSAVTGGKQMSGIVSLLIDVVRSAGLKDDAIYVSKALQLPGYFRPTKEWDLLVVYRHQLLAAIEVKSHVGPSFGNNFNNRVEEAIGSAQDIWTAFREKAFGLSHQPWLGYFMLVEECQGSTRPVAVEEPHFDVFPEFKGASHLGRYEIFCEKLLRERLYSSVALITSTRSASADGKFSEPSASLSAVTFVDSLRRNIMAVVESGLHRERE
jgi:hypothetical protein